MSSAGPMTEYALHQVVSSRQLLYSLPVSTGQQPAALQ